MMTAKERRATRATKGVENAMHSLIAALGYRNFHKSLNADVRCAEITNRVAKSAAARAPKAAA